jgi:hypothetical protein
MKRKTLVLSALVSAWSLSAGYALAGDPQTAKEEAQVQKPEQVYGSQLMTPEEQTAYRAKMRATKTTEERQQLRKEHHEEMQERAKARGVTLPAEPPARGRDGSAAARGPKNLYDGFQPRSGHWHEVLGRSSSGRPVNAVSRR